MPKHHTFTNSEHWRESYSDKGLWTCVVCADGTWREARNCARHEQSAKHGKAIRNLSGDNDKPRLIHPIKPSLITGPLLQKFKQLRDFGYDGINSGSIAESDISYLFEENPNTIGTYSLSSPSFNDTSSNDLNQSPSDFDSFNDIQEDCSESLHLAGPQDFDKVPQAEEPIMDIEIYSDIDEGMEVESENEADGEDGEEKESGKEYEIDLDALRVMTRARQMKASEQKPGWFPWPDKVYCIIDIIRHLPRSILSEKQHLMITWAMSSFGIQKIPNENAIKAVMERLQSIYSVRTIRYQGALGHVYYVNDLATLIAQEMANPKVRPHLQFFPEDAGQRMENANQARRWLYEMNPELLTPVIKQHCQEFFIFEPAILDNETVVVPFRFFKRNGITIARSWRIYRHLHGWLVYEFEELEIQTSRMLTSFTFFCGSYQQRGLPDPRNILGTIRKYGGQIERWTWTDPQNGNKWRERAKGHPVYAFPIWLYCDDTSGNSSKKWNKHNSFLFTPAGLSHDHIHYEYNVHFLCTSNLASPLEMLEGIESQLSKAQESGIWAWDCLEQCIVLLIPSVLALLGDNPMQSELSCHVGLNGTHFCRVCMVKASTQEKEANTHTNTDSSYGVASVTASNPFSDGNISDASVGSAASENGQWNGKNGGRRKKETMAEIVRNAREFLTIGTLRTKEETIKHLLEVYAAAKTMGSKTRSKNLKTQYGVKDNYLDYFIGKIFDFIKGLSGSNQDKQEELNKFVHSSLPRQIISPSFRIQGLDPSSDTPVEILHVILLGFVKYFWRDVMARLKADKKALLITRLCSLNTSGFGVPMLAGKTLVQFAGSLTGRDFRIISQIAPFILYDLVPLPCYKAWLALSALIPLVWQPVIYNVDAHIDKIECAVDLFLNRTASWTPRWFNKPKFHILLHLVWHVRRFGPPLLFATETFESYNALIRDLSVHSNRQAPSRDIGRGFANANRIRHLLSGGRFYMSEKNEDNMPLDQGTLEKELETSDSDHVAERPLPTPENYSIAGAEVLDLIENDPTLQRLCNVPGWRDNIEDKALKRDKKPSRNWSETDSSKTMTIDIAKSSKFTKHRYVGYKSCRLKNRDQCSLGDWVIWKDSTNRLAIGKVKELLQIVGSTSEIEKRPDLALLEMYYVIASPFTAGGDLSKPKPSTGMPKLVNSDECAVIDFLKLMCVVNVQHNCAMHNCNPTRARQVFQEREKVAALAPTIHHDEPGDLLLNCAQMRSFQYIQEFVLPSPPENRDQAIHEGAAREISTQHQSAGKKQKQTGINVVADGGSRYHKQTLANNQELNLNIRMNRSVHGFTSSPSSLNPARRNINQNLHR